MAESAKFQTWLKIRLGHIAVLEDKISRNIDSEVKVEVKQNGKWVTQSNIR